MKKRLYVLICLLFFSCGKEKNDVDELFLENLKETSAYYQSQIKLIATTIQFKYEERGEQADGYKKFDTLNQIAIKMNNFFDALKTKSKQEKILAQAKCVNKINSLSSEFKLTAISTDKLEVLDDESLDYYIEYKFYKILLDNYSTHLSKMPIYCGYKIPPEKIELTKIIENDTIE